MPVFFIISHSGKIVKENSAVSDGSAQVHAPGGPQPLPVQKSAQEGGFRAALAKASESDILRGDVLTNFLICGILLI